MSHTPANWAIAVFTARETVDTLIGCISAAIAACEGRNADFDILVNGNPKLALDTGKALGALALSPQHTIKVWSIPFGDKAHAWNEYIERIWEPSGLAFFIDGYAEVNPDALSLIEQGMGDNPLLLGATGVPTCGRSASSLRSQMLSEGGIHGNLYAIRGAVVQSLRETKSLLPLGLYRTDSLLGAMLNFQLDPAQHEWDPMRIHVQDRATWFVAATPWWKPNNIKGQFKRRLRQSQGTLENLAVRNHLAVLKRPPSAMPRTINQLVNDWLDADPARAKQTFMRDPLSLYAARKLRAPRDWTSANLLPVKVFERNAATSARRQR